ncbi:MAG TPA: ribonuclease E/G [Vitreimonas sp.]|nr:ribonuclease E/G [Vitreimonas sp.]
MTVALETWIDGAIGESREVLLRDGRPIALRIARESDAGRRARWGELYTARVREIDRQRRGGFVDLGLRDEMGFLPLGEDGRVRLSKNDRVALTQGAGVVVSVTREAARGKSPVLQLEATGRDGEGPHLMGRHACDEDLADAKPADGPTRAKIDAVIEDALSRMVPIPGGGALSIEPTAALVAIDVDAGARAGSRDPERFALDLNVDAAFEVARQIRLRSLGGLIAIDFVSMRAKSDRKDLEEAVRQAFADDPWSVQFGALSRFGVFDLARSQLRSPLHEQLRDGHGRLSAETLALMALRAIEREARAVSGRQIACTVSPEVKAWLDAAEFDWRGALNNRIGMIWTLDAQPGPHDRIDARAL